MRLSPESPQGRSTKDRTDIELGFGPVGFLLFSDRLENDHVVEIDVTVEISRKTGRLPAWNTARHCS